VTKKPTKAQVRAQAVAERQRASEAAAKQRRNRMILWGGLAVVVVIAIIVAVVSSGGDEAKATKWETAPVEVSGTPLPQFESTVSPDPAIGETIPTLTGKSIYDGSAITIGPDRGDKPQMILFVAHWCPHCQAEVPRLVGLADDGVFDGVDVSAVATATSKSADNYPPSAWLKRDDVKWPFPVMADSPTGTAAKAYGLSAYPYFVLVNADGTVAGRGSGELPEDQIKANIKAL
jgi:thiol-disulfide isomerase/thioredoxin